MIDQSNSLLALLREHAASGDFWKNIPIAQEYLDLIGQLHQDPDYAWWDTLAFCDAVFLEDLLYQRDVPRLCLRFMALRNQILSSRADSENQEMPEEYQELHLSEEDAQALYDKLMLYIAPSTRMEDWASRYGVMLRFDPVEMTPRWEEVIFEVECECERLLEGEPRGMGFCFAYWSTKSAVLAKHGIQWRSPAAMNPRVLFD